MNTKTERITLLGSRNFKAFLARESRKEGISMEDALRELNLDEDTDQVS